MGDTAVRGLLATRPTLKWFIVIGVIIIVVGLLIFLLISPPGGVILLWFGLILVAISLITLLFLWLSDRILPQPRR